MTIIENIIKPETALEQQIISDPEFIQGALWGKPRNGHPEGQVIYHIGDVLKNVDKVTTSIDREKMRLVAIIHDTFKYKVDSTKPKSGENHHAMIARRFAEKYITDSDILDVIELHDEAYNAWSKGNRHNDWKKAENRAKQLITRLGFNIDFFKLFYKCDNATGDKKSDDYIWFNELIRDEKERRVHQLKMMNNKSPASFLVCGEELATLLKK
jgi:hypothetical protein